LFESGNVLLLSALRLILDAWTFISDKISDPDSPVYNVLYFLDLLKLLLF